MRASSRALHSIKFIVFLHASLLIGSAAPEAAEVGVVSVIFPPVDAAPFMKVREHFSSVHTNKVEHTAPAAALTATPQEGGLRPDTEASDAAAATATPVSSTAFLPCGSMLRCRSYAVPVPFADSSSTAKIAAAVAPISLPIPSGPAYKNLQPLPSTPSLRSRQLSSLTGAAPPGVPPLSPWPAAFAHALPPFPNASTFSPLGNAYLAGPPKDSSFPPASDTSSASLSAFPDALTFTSRPHAPIEQLPFVSALPGSTSPSFHPTAANQLIPTLPNSAFLPPATSPSEVYSRTPLIPRPAHEAITSPSPTLSAPSSTTGNHLITAVNDASRATATDSPSSSLTESYSPAARKAVFPFMATDSSRVVISGDFPSQSKNDPSSFVGDAALAHLKRPVSSFPAGASPHVPPIAVSGDEVIVGLNVSDMVGTVVAAGAVSLENKEAPKEIQQERKQEEQPQSLDGGEAAANTFACCSGTWATASHLKNTPAVNIGGPIFAVKYSDEPKASLPDEDETFLEQFAKAKEEFYSTLVKKGRGYPRAHQVRSTSPTQQYNRKVPVTSLATAAPAGAPAAPAATVHPSANGRLKRTPSASANATVATGSARKTVTAAAAREVAAAATSIARVSPVGRTAASLAETEAPVDEPNKSPPEGHQRQHLQSGLHTGGGNSDNLTSGHTDNSQVETRVILKTEQVDSRTAVAGAFNHNTVAEPHGIIGDAQPHDTNAASQPHKRAVPKTNSNNVLAKALRTRSEADTSSSTTAVKQKNVASSLSPDTKGARTRGQQEEQNPYGKPIVETETGSDGAKRKGELQPSKAKSPAAGSLRRYSRNAEGVVQQRSKERKDRRFFCASGGTRRAAVPATVSLPAAQVASQGVGPVVPKVGAAISAAVAPTLPGTSPVSRPAAAVANAPAATGLAEEPRATRPRPEALLRTKTTPAYTSAANTAKSVGSSARAGNASVKPSTSTRTTLPASSATTGREGKSLPVVAGRGPSQLLRTTAAVKSAAVVPTAAAKGASRGRQAKEGSDPSLPAQAAPGGTGIPAAKQGFTRPAARVSPEGTRTGGRAIGPPVETVSAAERTQTVRMPAESLTGVAVTSSVSERLSPSISPLTAPASLPSVVRGRNEGSATASKGHGASSQGGHVAARSQQQTSVSPLHRRSAAASRVRE